MSVLNPRRIERIEAAVGAVIAQGGKVVNGLDARDVRALCEAYRVAQDVHGEAILLLCDHDLGGLRRQVERLPERTSDE